MTDPTPLPVPEKKETCPTCGSDAKHLLGTKSVEEFRVSPTGWRLARSGFIALCADPFHPTGEPSAALDVEQLAREWLLQRWTKVYVECDGDKLSTEQVRERRAVDLINYVLAKQKEAEGRK